MNKYLKLSFLVTLFTLLLILVACGSTNNPKEDTTFTVKFDLNSAEATGKPENQSVKKGEFATIPDDPELENYYFIGWYKEKTTINEFDFSEEITTNITLYAKWELEEDNTEIPDGLTYPEAYARIITYIEKAYTSSTEGINKCDEKNSTTLIVSCINLYMNVGFDLLSFAFTASFGDPNISEEAMELAFSYFGANADYTVQGNKYIMEYDGQDFETEQIVRYRYVVEYDPSTDSGKMELYQGYNTTEQSLESTFEFVKTNDGYAIQTNNGRYAFKIVNKEVVSYTFTYYEYMPTGPSIFKNASVVNANWASYNAEESISYDGSKYKFLEKEVDLYVENKYRINVYEFQIDGTLIQKTNGEWIISD